jgi:hypothetical protein
MTDNESTKLAVELSELSREFAILGDSESTPNKLIVLLHTLGRMFRIIRELHTLYDVVPIETLGGKA